MKKFKKLLGTCFALIMALSALAIPAYAEQVPVFWGTEADDHPLAINKYLVMKSGVATPSETFVFDIVSGEAVAGDGIQQPILPGPTSAELTSMSISFTTSTPTTRGSAESDAAGITTMGSDQQYVVSGPQTFDTSTVMFVAPGIYRYVVTEQAGIMNGMFYDPSIYYVDVYVGFETPEAESTGTLSILDTRYYLYRDDAGAIQNPLVKVGEIRFINNYNTTDLTIKKTVTGSMGDRSKDFGFTLDVTEGIDTGTRLHAVKYDASGMVSQNNIEITVGGPYSFNLKADEKLVISGMPQNTKYTVTEDDYITEGYSTRFETTYGVHLTVPPSPIAGPLGSRIAEAHLLDADGNLEEFTNSRDVTPPTGILLDVAPYALVVLLAAAAAALMILKKRRHAGR